MKSRAGILAATLAAGAYPITKYLVQRHRRIRWRGRSAVITGGSRGLGLILARELCREGAEVTLIARIFDELDAARRDLVDKGAVTVDVIACDVGRRDEVEAAITEVLGRRGRIDLLINNAGIIQVGPLEHMTPDDFEEAMAIHFWGPFIAMMTAIPAMRRAGGGRIVNISSIGGKVAVPHLAPYVASKFALTGLSDAVRAELARDNIYVTTVAPGLMRTGSHINVAVRGRHQEEFTWFALGAGAPLLSVNANRAARQILEAAAVGKPALDIGLPARAMIAANALAPSLVGEAMAQVNRLLPPPTGEAGKVTHLGGDSRSRWTRSPFTYLADRAAAENNEGQRLH